MKYVSQAGDIGDIVRGLSAVGVGALGTLWFSHQPADMRNGFANSVDEAFGAYGVGETINNFKSYRENKRSGENLLQYFGRLARESPLEAYKSVAVMAPMAAPVIARFTENDFLTTIGATFFVMVTGHTAGYVARELKARRSK